MRQPIQVLVYVARHNASEWQYLLLHRIARADDFWQGVTGGVENDETLLQAAGRELEEETGFTPKWLVDLDHSYTFPVADKWRDLYAPGVREIREHVFLAEVPAEADPAIDPREHDAWRWCPFEEALDWLRWPDNRDALRRAHSWLADRRARAAQNTNHS